MFVTCYIKDATAIIFSPSGLFLFRGIRLDTGLPCIIHNILKIRRTCLMHQTIPTWLTVQKQITLNVYLMFRAFGLSHVNIGYMKVFLLHMALSAMQM